MSLRFRDLLAAKVALQMQAITPDAARATLTSADREEVAFVQVLSNRGFVPEAQAQLIDRGSGRAYQQKAESFYSGMLKRMMPHVDVAAIETARMKQKGGDERRLGELLIEDGQLTPMWDEKVIEAAKEYLDKDDLKAVDRYRSKMYAGIERPSSTIADIVKSLLAAAPAPTPAPSPTTDPSPTPAPAPTPAAAEEQADDRPVPDPEMQIAATLVEGELNQMVADARAEVAASDPALRAAGPGKTSDSAPTAPHPAPASAPTQDAPGAMASSGHDLEIAPDAAGADLIELGGLTFDDPGSQETAGAFVPPGATQTLPAPIAPAGAAGPMPIPGPGGTQQLPAAELPAADFVEVGGGQGLDPVVPPGGTMEMDAPVLPTPGAPAPTPAPAVTPAAPPSDADLPPAIPPGGTIAMDAPIVTATTAPPPPPPAPTPSSEPGELGPAVPAGGTMIGMAPMSLDAAKAEADPIIPGVGGPDLGPAVPPGGTMAMDAPVIDATPPPASPSSPSSEPGDLGGAVPAGGTMIGMAPMSLEDAKAEAEPIIPGVGPTPAPVVKPAAAAPTPAPVTPPPATPAAPPVAGTGTQVLPASIVPGVTPLSAAVPTPAPAAAARPAASPVEPVSDEPELAPATASVAPIKGDIGVTCMFPNPLNGTGLETKYIPEKELGRGGMGAVYLAHEIDGGRKVALKLILDAQKSADAVARFKREILATAMVDHDNVIHIWDAGETQDGAYFMAMESVPGEELADILEKRGALELKRCVHILDQILLGLESVHRGGVVHRDIKPENFRIFRDEKKGGIERVKIMDFGIARLLNKDSQFKDQIHQTMTGFITGSPAYIAPESVANPDVDQRADLYSLGISLYYMLCGKLPFEAKRPTDYLQMHLCETPPPLRQVNPKVPAELEAIVNKLLEKEPEDRYQNAEQVINDLNAKVHPVLGLEQVAHVPMPAAQGTIVMAIPDIEALKNSKSVSDPIKKRAAAEPAGFFGKLKGMLGI